MNLNNSLKKSKRKKWVIRFKTKHSEGDTYDGVVAYETKSFIIIITSENFDFDGYTILSRNYVSGHRDGEYEISYNKVLRFNGQDKKIKGLGWFSECKTWEDVFQNFHKRNIWPAVETLTSKGKYSDLYIGPITGGTNKEFLIHSYDAKGEWEREYTLNYNDVLKVNFNDKYTKNFNKYMKSKL